MKVLAYLLCSITFASLQLADCVSVCPDDIAPCKCYPVTQQIVCTGPELSDMKLLELGKKLVGSWKYLYIHWTEITRISLDTFKNVEFEEIFIVSNSKLTTIDPTAFKKSSITASLTIRDNHVFNDPKLFTLVKLLGKSLKVVELDKNAITAIPDHAFDDGTTPEADRAFKLLEIIKLDDQRLSSIGSSSFANLPMLKQLSLNKNKIGSIGAAGIDLSRSDVNAGEHISLFLEDNDLTEASVRADKIILPAKVGVSVGLVLNRNKIASLSTPFAQFVYSIAHVAGGKVYLNEQLQLPTCLCVDVKYIVDIFKTASPSLKGNIQGLTYQTCLLGTTRIPIRECPII